MLKRSERLDFNNLSISGREKLTNADSDSFPSPFASKHIGAWCSLASSTMNESVYTEAVEVGSDIDQQIESRRLIGVIGRIGILHVCNYMKKREVKSHVLH